MGWSWIKMTLYDSDFNMRKGFYEHSKLAKKKESDLVKRIEYTLLKRQHFRELMHNFRRDVCYYIKQGWSKTEARRYVKYWYRK